MKNILNANAEIIQVDVEKIHFEDETFDILITFETVYFWLNIEKSFVEVKKVLKLYGIFLIGRESS